jgi:acetyl-CoA carboxylase biotin carboxyl carrier protein
VSLSAADVAEIMRLVEQSTFDELILEIDGVKLELRRGSAFAQGAAAGNAAGFAQGLAGGHGAASGQGAAGGQGALVGQGAVLGGGGQLASGNTTGVPSAALASASAGASPNSAAIRAGAGHGSDSRASPSRANEPRTHEAGAIESRDADAARSSGSPLDPSLHEIQSPLLGTFYRSPKPGAPPFVEVGSVVDEDTTVAIIEVMKLMNTVRAGVRGTVTEVLAADGALVEFEQPLLRVRKAG